jgi:hypothetical protein
LHRISVWGHDRLAAELSGLLQIGGRVVDLDVDADLAGPAVLSGADPAADSLLRAG